MPLRIVPSAPPRNRMPCGITTPTIPSGFAKVPRDLTLENARIGADLQVYRTV